MYISLCNSGSMVCGWSELTIDSASGADDHRQINNWCRLNTQWTWPDYGNGHRKRLHSAAGSEFAAADERLVNVVAD